MEIYARIDDGVVVEIIQPATYETPDPSIATLSGREIYEDLLAKAGQEIPISQRFTPQFVSTLVDITSANPQPQIGWTYSGTQFSQPI